MEKFFMKTRASLSQLFASIQDDLDLVDKTFQERAASGLTILNSASMHALASPGKRLRTAITLLSGKLRQYNRDKLLLLSVAFELVHLATLIHDDIVDEAKTRRGNPTVNSVWGDKIAILLGDYYFAKTAGLIADIEDFKIDHLFSDTLEAYYEKIERKTACLIAACCKGGAILGQASPEEVELLYQYGLQLGIAFQIVDDILDYTEDQSTIGKPVGNDLRQGMVTLPLIYALQEQPTEAQRQLVQEILNGVPHEEAEIRCVVDWVVNSQAIKHAMLEAHAHGNKAREALYHFPPSDDRDILDELIDFVIMRKI
jgi:geranylgeranyl pyrophosphate synthase